ncbi:aminoglycoside phosphotransferase family protein [Orrella marina]|uniref:Aminoglycoside phosphotransferase n=1 Tax=Orrella marina TaxID=2163011 RepID=A0A2R4XN77_9BURK|nr:phosphotransferase [Orrella marina]AWB35266.1 aminoglycoside phosphotransferase [Orrella marina]
MTQRIELEARRKSLIQWLESLPESLELDVATLSSASSDASFRRYDRLQAGNRTLIVMDAPPPFEDCRPFVDVTRRLSDVALSVPQILAVNLEDGFLLLSDLGNQTYYDRIQSGIDDMQRQSLYRCAIEALVTLQHASADGLPVFDATRLLEELQVFTEWYVKVHHQTELSVQEHEALNGIFEVLASHVANEPAVLVHRDFHSPNLMVPLPETPEAPGIIDYQDAVKGAISYDLASLVFDARTTWEEAQQLDWAIRYWERARQQKLPVPDDFAQFHMQYEWTGLQRNLRILGVFARLNHRDDKSHYLDHIPRVLGYVRQVAQRYRPFIPLLRLLDRLEGIERKTALTF